MLLVRGFCFTPILLGAIVGDFILLAADIIHRSLEITYFESMSFPSSTTFQKS